MRGLPHPVQGSQGTAFDIRSDPSLAQDLVAGLQNLPERTAGPRGQSSGTGVKVGPAQRLGYGA
jgi:hypothetical protein